MWHQKTVLTFFVSSLFLITTSFSAAFGAPAKNAWQSMRIRLLPGRMISPQIKKNLFLPSPLPLPDRSVPFLPSSSTFTKTFGAAGSDSARSIVPTFDGGYLIAGYTNSFGAGRDDAWVLKLDRNGVVRWQKTYGGAGADVARFVQILPDGGFVLVGGTHASGSDDAWILRLDENGRMLWQKSFGGADTDFAKSVQPTSDGGFVVVGDTYSFGSGNSDAWVLKLDADGNTLWQKAYGGSAWDSASSIQITPPDEGFVMAGSSSGGAWIVKLDRNGNILWQKIYALSGSASAETIQLVPDGGFIVAGSIQPDGATYPNVWLLKLSNAGDILWQKSYGGDAQERVYSLQPTHDGGFIVAGETTFSGARFIDAWLLKLERNGDILWQRAYGGSDADSAYSAHATADGGFIVGGTTVAFGAGSDDAWVLKLDSEGHVVTCAGIEAIPETGSAATPTTATSWNSETLMRDSAATSSTFPVSEAASEAVSDTACPASP